MGLFSIKFLLFMIVAIFSYYLVPQRHQWKVLLIASIGFYVLGGGAKALIFIVATVVSTYYGAKEIDRENQRYKEDIENHEYSREEKKIKKEESQKIKKRVFLWILLINFGILAVLKYGNFVTENLNQLLHLNITKVDFILPLGISFYTFQTMGYLIDVYRGKYGAQDNIFKLALYTTYFPQMIQGPIGRYDELSKELYSEHDIDEERFRKGIVRMLWGYFKKMVVAERMAIIVNEIIKNYPTNEYVGLTIFIGVLFYGIQMYADFSGGIDIVLGISELFGIKMTENFRQPFMSKSVNEFWQRWHMSLGNWMRDYVFYPIALSKRFNKLSKSWRKKIGPYYGKIMPSVLASFIVFLIVGIWHGANWKYVVYGTYHAILVSSNTLLEKVYKGFHEKTHIKEDNKVWGIWMMIRTTILITIGRYFDCATDVHMAMDMFKKTLSTFNPSVLFNGSFFEMGLTKSQLMLLAVTILVVLIVDILNEKGIKLGELIVNKPRYIYWIIIYCITMFILIFGMYGPGYKFSDFMYQKF